MLFIHLYFLLVSGVDNHILYTVPPDVSCTHLASCIVTQYGWLYSLCSTLHPQEYSVAANFCFFTPSPFTQSPVPSPLAATRFLSVSMTALVNSRQSNFRLFATSERETKVMWNLAMCETLVWHEGKAPRWSHACAHRSTRHMSTHCPFPFT